MTESPRPAFQPPSSYAPPSRPAGVPMIVRHLVGVVVALVVTPIGMLVFDYGAGRYQQERLVRFNEAGVGAELATMVAGMVLLVLVAASSRLSGLGPVVAGLVWGVLPFIWFSADLGSFYDFAQDMPTTHFWFAVPTYLFLLVSALLVGAGLGGRWLPRTA